MNRASFKKRPRYSIGTSISYKQYYNNETSFATESYRDSAFCPTHLAGGRRSWRWRPWLKRIGKRCCYIDRSRRESWKAGKLEMLPPAAPPPRQVGRDSGQSVADRTTLKEAGGFSSPAAQGPPCIPSARAAAPNPGAFTKRTGVPGISLASALSNKTTAFPVLRWRDI